MTDKPCGRLRQEIARFALFSMAILLMSIAVPGRADIAAEKDPIRVNGPFYNAETLAPGDEIAVRFEIASTQTSDVQTVAALALFSGAGERIDLSGNVEGRRLRLTNDSVRVVEYKLLIPEAAPPDTYVVLLDLLPAKIDEPAYFSSREFLDGKVFASFTIAGVSSSAEHPHTSPSWTLAPRFPDLAISDLRLAPSVLRRGDTLAIAFRARNLGKAAAGTTRLAAFIGDRALPSHEAVIDGIPAEGEVELSMTLPTDATWLQDGIHRINLVLDPDGELDDRDRRNNRAAASFELLPAPPTIRLTSNLAAFTVGTADSEPRAALFGIRSGGEDLEITIEADVPWLDARPSTMRITRAERELRVLANPVALPPGGHEGVILIRGQGPGEGLAEKISVTLTVVEGDPLPSVTIHSARVEERPAPADAPVSSLAPGVHLTWLSDGLASDARFKLELHIKEENRLVTLVDEMRNDGAWSGEIPHELLEELSGREVHLKLGSTTNPEISFESDESIFLTTKTLRLIEPAQGQRLTKGDNAVLSWFVSGGVDAVQCEYRIEGEDVWCPIAVVEAHRNRLEWEIPADLPGDALFFRISSYDEPNLRYITPFAIGIDERKLTLADAADPYVAGIEVEGGEMRVRLGNKGEKRSAGVTLEIRLNDHPLRVVKLTLPSNADQVERFPLPSSGLSTGENELRARILPVAGNMARSSSMDFDPTNNEWSIVLSGPPARTDSAPDAIPDPNGPALARRLLLERFELEPESPREGDLVTLTASLRNISDRPIDHVYVEFHDGDRLIAGFNAPTDKRPLAPGASRIDEMTATLTRAGFYTLRAVIVAPNLDDQIESDVKSIRIQVAADPGQWVEDVLTTELVDAYNEGKIDYLLSFYLPQFRLGQGQGTLNREDYGKILRERRRLFDAVESAIMIEEIRSSTASTASVTYQIVEKLKWKDWDQEMRRVSRWKDDIIHENGRWLIKSRARLEP